MSARAGARWGALLGAAVFVACSGGEDSNDAVVKPVVSVFQDQVDDAVLGGADAEGLPEAGDAALPSVEALVFEPAEPVSGSKLRAVARTDGSGTSLEYEWTLNGERLRAHLSEVTLPELGAGDRIGVRVVPVRGRMRGAPASLSVEVGNQPPRITGVVIVKAEPDEFWGEVEDDGELWKASVRAEDPEGDTFDLEYRWLLNDHAVDDEDGETFPAYRLARGDRLEVEVRAFDGRSYGPGLRSGRIEVGNGPPTIVSIPPRPGPTGRFRYQLEVEDPDGDRNFRYRLAKAPRGMRVDEANGVVSWAPDTDQAGRHEVEIVVSDAGGAEATQSFSLALVAQSEQGGGPAAPH